MTPDERKAEPLPYAASPNTVSVRGFRLLIALTLLNTTLLGGFVLGPAFSGFFKQQWAAYQQRKADEKADAAEAAKKAASEAAAAARLKGQLAAQSAALAYAPPSDLLLYDDDPALRDPPTSAPRAAPWPQALPTPEPYRHLLHSLPQRYQSLRPPVIPVFVALLRASLASEPRLVTVVVDPRDLLAIRPDSSTVGRRHVVAVVCPPMNPKGGFRNSTETEYVWKPPQFVWETMPTPAELADAPSLCLFAGEADATDPSRFVIRYKLGGVGGFLRGQLQGDDSVRLVPEGPMAGGWSSKGAR